jgi:hypothetical protein
VQKDPEQMFCSGTQRHVPHPGYGYSGVPGNTFFEKTSPIDNWFFVHINDEGFRDNFNSGNENVIVLGDSFVRGTLVDESEQFGYLLDLWHPDIAFRTYGVGGFGQANEFRLYESLGSIPHRLVILAYAMANDLDDNAKRARVVGSDVQLNLETQVSTAKSSFMRDVHSEMWTRTALYPLVFRTILEPLFRPQHRDIDNALRVTRQLLAMIADQARRNGAELLIVPIPSWNEVAGLSDGMAYDRQHAMLDEFAASTPEVSLIDTVPLFRQDYTRNYGLADKHLSGYGQFLIATAIDRWMESERISGSQQSGPGRQYVPASPITPDCALTAVLVQKLKHPRT